MRMSRLEITNIKGVEHIELRLKSLTRIRGRNGSGKSSIVDAAMSFFQGGSDPGWLRKGCSKGCAVMEICDDLGEIVGVFTKTVEIKKDGSIKSTLEGLDKNGVVIPAPQTFVNRLGESWAVDPSSILTIDASKQAGKKALIAKMLEVMPVSFDASELIGCGCPNEAIKGSAVNLDGLAKSRKYVEDMRRRVGVERDEAQGAVQTFRKSLPGEGEDKTDWSARVREIEQERLALTQTEESEKTAITKDAGVERQARADEFATEERALHVEYQAKLKAIEERKAASLAEVDKLEQDRLEETRKKFYPDHERLAGELGTARAKSDEMQRAQGVRDSMAKFELREREKAVEYLRLSRVLEKLDDLKKERLKDLDIDGLDFDGENFTVEGVPWEHVNKSRRGLAAAQLCALGSGELKFLAYDDAEHMDSETRESFEQGLIDAGFQVLEALVDDVPLTVESVA